MTIRCPGIGLLPRSIFLAHVVAIGMVHAIDLAWVGAHGPAVTIPGAVGGGVVPVVAYDPGYDLAIGHACLAAFSCWSHRDFAQAMGRAMGFMSHDLAAAVAARARRFGSSVMTFALIQVSSVDRGRVLGTDPRRRCTLAAYRIISREYYGGGPAIVHRGTYRLEIAADSSLRDSCAAVDAMTYEPDPPGNAP